MPEWVEQLRTFYPPAVAHLVWSGVADTAGLQRPERASFSVFATPSVKAAAVVSPPILTARPMHGSYAAMQSWNNQV
jgi:hypothetical protein